MSLETMTKLASTTVGVAGAATIDFTNIPQNYTDLVIKLSTRISNANVWSDIYVRFNNETTGYTDRVVYGSGTAAASLTDTANSGIDIRTSTSANTTSTFGNAEVYISNYTGSNYKVVSVDGVSENNATAAITQSVAGIWSNTSIINSITIVGAGGNLLQHSTATLYGIKNARQTAGNSIKATGGNIVFDGTYVYHVFNTSGSFVPTQPIYADYLVVAGGGGGGNSTGGGGGAGGYRTSTGTSGGGGSAESKLSLLSSNSYTVTIGSGGSGNSSSQRGTQGSASSFSTIESTGGGGGSGTSGGQSTPTSGGSGGGGFASGGTGAAGTANQGFAGGNGAGGAEPAGGGGGAGAVGQNAPSTSQSGNGGVGLSFSMGDSTLQLAGGGGGGGLGASTVIRGTGSFGGGSGSNSGAGTNGTTNTGGGGGGGYWSGSAASSSGNGGSGIVIIKYKG